MDKQVQRPVPLTFWAWIFGLVAPQILCNQGRPILDYRWRSGFDDRELTFLANYKAQAVLHVVIGWMLFMLVTFYTAGFFGVKYLVFTFFFGLILSAIQLSCLNEIEREYNRRFNDEKP